MGRVKFPPEVREAVRAGRQAGATIPALADSHGLSVSTVRYLCAGIRVSREQAGRNVSEANGPGREMVERVADLRRLGASVAQIMEQTGLSRGSVKHCLRLSGVTLDKTRAQRHVDEGRRRAWLARWEARDEAGVLERLAEVHGGRAEGVWEGAARAVPWVCAAGHSFTMRPDCVARGQWCPRCARPSRPEEEIYAWVSSLCPDALRGDRTAIAPMELDVWVPSRRLGIEFNGLLYHSSFFGDDEGRRGRHQRKALACRERGVRLLAIYEDEWADEGKRDLIKSMIRWRLGLFEGQRLNARDLELNQETYGAEIRAFFEKNHLDGDARASGAWTLRYQGEIVCAASIRVNFAGETEVCRLATRQGVAVRGGAGRVLSRVPGPLYTYSNNRLGDGEVYRELGFRCIEERQRPSYWYTDLKSRVWRWQCRRDNTPEVLERWPTEEQQARAGVFSPRIFGHHRPLYRIEDYGHRKWLRA